MSNFSVSSADYLHSVTGRLGQELSELKFQLDLFAQMTPDLILAKKERLSQQLQGPVKSLELLKKSLELLHKKDLENTLAPEKVAIEDLISAALQEIDMVLKPKDRHIAVHYNGFAQKRLPVDKAVMTLAFSNLLLFSVRTMQSDITLSVHRDDKNYHFLLPVTETIRSRTVLSDPELGVSGRLFKLFDGVVRVQQQALSASLPRPGQRLFFPE